MGPDSVAGLPARGAAAGGSWFPGGFALHPAGEWVVVPTQDVSRLTFWPLPRAPVQVVDGYANTLRPAVFSPDGRFLVSSGRDHTVRLWDLDTGRARVIDGHSDRVTSLAFSPDGRLLATSRDGVARLNAYLDDYAYLIDAILALLQARRPLAMPASGTK